MIPTILLGGLVILAVALAIRKRIRDFKNHRYCGSCRGCSGSCGGSTGGKIT